MLKAARFASRAQATGEIPEHMQKHLAHVRPPPTAAAAAAAAPTAGGVAGGNILSQAAVGRTVGGAAPAATSVSSAIDARVSRQASAREQVFRDPNPPTKTLDQWVQEEQAAGRMPMPAGP